jgi:hypothetical protein
MRHFYLSVNLFYLVQGIKVRREPSMQAEYLVLDDGSKWKQIKQICVVFPDIRITVLPKALVIKPIHLCDLTRFVVSSQDCNSVLESHFQCNQQSHCLH